MNSTTSLATLVYNARVKKGFSQEELADLCQVSCTEIANIEKGKVTHLRLSLLGDLSKNLEIAGKLIRETAGYFPSYSAKNNTIGAVVERTRLESFLSKARLAEACNTTPLIIRNIENGKTKWTHPGTREALAEVLNIDFSLVEKNHPSDKE